MSAPASIPPRVAITDPPVPLPPGCKLPALVPKPAGWDGMHYFRTLRIPLPAEDAFRRQWDTHKEKFLRRGFKLTREDHAMLLSQNLAGAPGAYTLTPRGAELLEEALDCQPQLALTNVEPVLAPLPGGLEKYLYPYQVTPARQLHRAIRHGFQEWGYPGAADLSDMGTGKTASTLAAMLAAGRKPVILCPVVGKAGWEWMCNHFGAQPHGIFTYEALRMGNRPHIAELRADGSFEWKNAGEIGLIMDEAQAVRHPETITYKLCEGAIRQGIPIIVASATIAISPLEFKFAGRITGLHTGGTDWDRFLLQHGCTRPHKGAAFKWDGDLRHLSSINQRLFPWRGCRMRTEDCGEYVQPTSISVLTVDSPEAELVEQEWASALHVLGQMRDAGVREGVIENKRRILYMHILQRIEMATVEPVSKIVLDTVKSGKSCPLFMSFTRSRIAMSKRLNSFAGIYGGVPAEKRKFLEREFQAHRLRILVNQIGAGGASVSLHDIHGDYPRTAFIWLHDNPVYLQQATGRVAGRAGGKTPSEQFIVTLRGELSLRQVQRMRAKIQRLSVLNDGAGAGDSRF